MSDVARQVMVIDRDPVTAELIAMLLQDAGFGVSSMHTSAGALTEVRRLSPSLVILDLPPGEPIEDECCHLLDALRVDPVTRRIPVMVTATTSMLAESAMASYNVKATVTKPFDLEPFMEKVRQALELAPMAASIPSRAEEPLALLRRGEKVMALRSREALLRWVHRLHCEEPWKSRPDVSLTDLLNGTPLLVEAVHAALLYAEPDSLFQEHPNALDRIREHAMVRRHQRISLDAVIREYTLLRDELWGTIWCDLHGPVHSSDVYHLQRSIAGTLDRIIEVTVRTYLESP